MSISMPARIRSVVVLALAVLLALPASARAQSTATLQGTGSDAQGAVMPGVTITIHNEQTGAARIDVSEASGSYLAAALPPGRYKITAYLEGFRDQVQLVDLQVAQTVAVNINLAVGGISEQAEVTASTPVIETTDRKSTRLNSSHANISHAVFCLKNT